jgi:hypothetical protein
MKAKLKSKTEQELTRAAKKALSGENLADMGPASKPLSFHPMKLETAVAALLRVKPEPKK